MKGKVWWTLLGLLIILKVEAVPLRELGFDKDPLVVEDQRIQMMWVDSVFQKMTLEESLGQLFMVAAFSNKDELHKQEIAKLIEEHNLGGLIFFQGGPVRQANLTNYYQSISKTPLFIAMDAEWGLNMRLDSVISFPKAMTLGALQNDDLVYEMGREVARQFQELGMHINFAPVVDVNSNPNNPVIGYRAFGEEKRLVARKSLAYMKGLQDHGVMANAKHFPGHGDTETDSHFSLPVIKHSESRIKDIDLYPYRELMDAGLMSVMIAHLHIPSLDNEKNKATTLSKYVVSDLLKTQMNFEGLIFTDALNMKGVSSFHKPGEVDVLALLAGNDILLYSEDVPEAKMLILKAIEEGKITRKEVEDRIKKILKAKYWAGLHRDQKINTNDLVERLSSPQTELLVESLYSEAITVTSNKSNFLPLKNLDLLDLASVTIGGDGRVFQSKLDKYSKFEHFAIPKGTTDLSWNQLEEKLSAYNTVVVAIMGVTNNPQREFGISISDINMIQKLAREKTVITILFGNSYGAKFLKDLPHNILAFEENDFTQALVPEIIFGARSAKGILPVSIGNFMSIGTGSHVEESGRLSYSLPESQNMDSRVLSQIDGIMERAIFKKATPGGVVLIARKGQVIFEKAYGYQDYQESQKVTTETVYDLASITKVLATTQAVMFLADRGLIEMDKPLSKYLPELKETNKGNLLIKDVMAHEAGLQAYIPHYARTVSGGSLRREYFNDSPNELYTLAASQDMYGINSLRDSIWHWTVKSELRKLEPGKRKHGYVYSDLTMYLMKELVEKIVNQPLDEFLEYNFYAPLGLYTLTYNPANLIPIDQIAPTEDDFTWRRKLVRGYVHDQGAAMLGGVAGHAGLFGKANDLAIVMQAMLNGGNYGDVSLMDKKTIREFTKKQSNQSRRGWGWDKPEPENGKGGGAGKMAPKSTFGHTGFTGGSVWADPDNEIIYVFLSNRVFPNANNNTLLKEGVRTEIHDVIYKALLD